MTAALERLTTIGATMAEAAVNASSVIADGVLYFGSDDGYIYAVELPAPRHTLTGGGEGGVASSVRINIRHMRLACRPRIHPPGRRFLQTGRISPIRFRCEASPGEIAWISAGRTPKAPFAARTFQS
jgi:PQQ-like domain